VNSYRTVRLLAFVVLVSSAALGQSGGTKGSRGTTVSPPTTPSNLPNQVIMLSGSVITADGTPLSEPASIERVCNGRVSREGRSDFKGFFTVSLGTYPPGLSDPESSAEATGGGGLSPMSTLNSPMSRNTSPAARLLGCELRASLAGFRSSSVLIPTEDLGSGVGVVKVGTIVLERMGEAPGATVSATGLRAPKDAKKAYDKGHHAIAGNKLPEAQQDLEKAVQLYPQYAAAWLDLGWVYSQQNQLDKARTAFEQARTADGMFVPAYVGLASVALRESKWKDAADLSAHATGLDTVDFPAAFYYNCLANYRLGNLVQAEKSGRKAEMLGAQRSFPQVSLLLGIMLANRQDYAEAADELRAYLKAAPTAPNADKVRQQLAEVEKLGGAGTKAEAAAAVK
jgi:outer membrane protein assembly factor BamD (BamD/ComL family)